MGIRVNGAATGRFSSPPFHHTVRRNERSMKKLPRSFYVREAAEVAQDLVGTVLVRGKRRARIVETEAYIGEHDLACHASRGRTSRTEVMYGPAGRAYVYFIYGMYDMLNIVTGPKGVAQAVLIRAAEALDDWDADLSGPGKLTRAFGITVRGDNGLDLTGSKMYLAMAEKKDVEIRQTPRIGVEYAQHWQHELLRFIDTNSKAVSGPRHLRGAGLSSKQK
jgi:DNA-3-methyladenine glycosylase